MDTYKGHFVCDQVWLLLLKSRALGEECGKEMEGGGKEMEGV
jgi:hypothetical protein